MVWRVNQRLYSSTLFLPKNFEINAKNKKNREKNK